MGYSVKVLIKKYQIKLSNIVWSAFYHKKKSITCVNLYDLMEKTLIGPIGRLQFNLLFCLICYNVYNAQCHYNRRLLTKLQIKKAIVKNWTKANRLWANGLNGNRWIEWTWYKSNERKFTVYVEMSRNIPDIYLLLALRMTAS